MSLADYFKIGDVHRARSHCGRLGLVCVEKLDDDAGKVIARDVRGAVCAWPAYWLDTPAHRRPRAGIYTGDVREILSPAAGVELFERWGLDTAVPYAEAPSDRIKAFYALLGEDRAKEIW